MRKTDHLAATDITDTLTRRTGVVSVSPVGDVIQVDTNVENAETLTSSKCCKCCIRERDDYGNAKRDDDGN